MKRTGVKQPDMPTFIPPCLATMVGKAPSGNLWAHEIKFDGYRLQARVENGTIRIFTRSGLDWTARFPALAKTLRDLKVRSAIIDGEAVVEDERGVSSFVKLVDALKTGRSEHIVFFAFDLVYLDGESLIEKPLTERKAHLQTVLKGQKNSATIRFSRHLQGDGNAILAQACLMGLEGIVSKRLDKPYRSGRHDDWLKAKCLLADEFVVAGYLDSKEVKDAIGALVLGFYEDGALVYAGRVGTGFTRRSASELWQQSQSLRIDTAHFAARLAAIQRRGVTWLKPKMVVQVEYRAWTGDGLLRHAVFKAIREDKLAQEVKRPGAKG